MATHPSPSNSHPYGRIRVDETTSVELIRLLEKELRVADQMRHEWSIRGQDVASHEYNQYMRRLRRVIRELQRTRDEMGWKKVEISELAERS